MHRRAFFATVLAALSALPALAQAPPPPAVNPPLYSPILLGGTWSDATNSFVVPMQARPTGGTATVQALRSVGTDLSWNRFGSGRCFLTVERFVDTSAVDGLVVYDESGTQRTELTTLADNLQIWRVAWSRDGNRIAWVGGKWDQSDPTWSTYSEYGVYVADVALDAAGNPAAAVNIRQVASGTSTQLRTNPQFVSWTSDQQYLTFLTGDGGYSGRLWRVRADGTAAPQEIRLNLGSNSALIRPKASPAAGDNRIAFQGYGARGSVAAYDLWTVDVPANYDPATTVLTPKQITSKSNVKDAPSVYYYDWSPDGAQFVLNLVPLSLGYRYVVSVSSHGGGSATTLLKANRVSYQVYRWRP